MEIPNVLQSETGEDTFQDEPRRCMKMNRESVSKYEIEFHLQ